MIAGQTWGRREMLCHPGLVETLMDRSVDKEREGREGRLITFKLKLQKEKVGDYVGLKIGK